MLSSKQRAYLRGLANKENAIFQIGKGGINDEILKELIHNGKGIEINTGGLFHLPFANPHKKILMRYRELGGEILTTGSDGHTPERIAHAFDKLPELLKECGFKYTTIFKNRKPEWIKI